MEFKPFPKMSRWSRDIVISEKIDGTNASIYISPATTTEDLTNVLSERFYDTALGTRGRLHLRAGSRTRWITPADDNYGFARWAAENVDELFGLGEGHHVGEWWGRGIQRNYSQPTRRFSLFNSGRWAKGGVLFNEGESHAPDCCDVVPVLYSGPNEQSQIAKALHRLAEFGSVAAPGFMQPEGIVIFHTASGESFKKTLEKDESPKSVIQSRIAG